MHDPMTKIVDITIPFTGRKNSKGGWDKYPKTLITIWHVDPEKDGTDDSCGWFIRARHCDQEILKRVEERFAFEWQYLFYENGLPKFSPGAITLFLFGVAAFEHFRAWKKSDRFIQSNIAEIFHFAENPRDSIHDAIMHAGYISNKQERSHYFATVIYPYIVRKLTPWWKHPRWHIHHWKLQNVQVQLIKRWAFSRCAGCGDRFAWGYSPTSTQWDGTGPQWFKSERNVYHRECVPVPQRVEKYSRGEGE